MIVYAVYVITDDGRTILSEYFQSSDDIPNDILLGGLLTALQQMTSEMTKSNSEMKSIKIEGLSYHIRSFGFVRIVLVTDVPKTPEDIMQTLGLRFINEYGDVLTQMDFNLNIFNPFKETIHEVVMRLVGYDESKSIRPSKKLNTGEIFSLPHDLQATALALVSLEKGTVKAIAKESGEKVTVTRKNLNILKEKGYIGTKKEKRTIIYFCSI